ncbi:hypothetical protein AAFF_G00115110 [Aldrovandia affinis]|uniref:Ig-like domain-containing protein n=1 Tax=Aldrovandia affinis TaxID=143900 RepID=A0AAD7VX56_9TELE|nr:hypothetical protein AAFF_G00115110 [Aldrovandia affinis]
MMGDSFQDEITTVTNAVDAVEGNNVTLSCNYTTSVPGGSLHWYRQYPRSKPDFLILIMRTANPESIQGRLTVKHDQNNQRVDLELSSAEVSDSALYYCALQPTVTGNPYTLYKNLTPPETSCRSTIETSALYA